MHFSPNGNVLPCCVARQSQPVGRLQDQSVAEIWNSQAMRQLRLDMLAGRANTICQKCHQLDSIGVRSPRTNSLEQFAADKQLVTDTAADGTVDPAQITYLDVRWNNTCNLKCRTCGPRFSTSWYEDYQKLGWSIEQDKTKSVLGAAPDFLEQIEPYLAGLKQVQFAGGEPLIMQPHYDFLDALLQANNKKVLLRYTTNFSKLTFRNRDVLQAWKKFDRVQVYASLDATGTRGEYIRKNLDWPTVLRNRRRILNECPHVAFAVTQTISIFNAYSFIDVHRELIENQLLAPEKISLAPLSDPASMSIAVLPRQHKHNLRLRYLKHIDWLRQFGSATADTIRDMEGLIRLLVLDTDENPELLQRFLSDAVLTDQIRGENFFRTFPELADLTDVLNETDDNSYIFDWKKTALQSTVKEYCDTQHASH